MDLHERIDRDLTNQPPSDPRLVSEGFEPLREAAKAFAHLVADLVPPGREQSRSLTAIEDATMQAVAGIARNQEAFLALLTQRPEAG